MNYYLLLPLCLLLPVLATEMARLSLEATQTGVWFNKGQVYPRCSELHFQRLHCSNFSLTESRVSRKRLWQPDCPYLMRRLVCTLYTINCPSLGASSFQMYDIPCQASCYAAVDLCGMQAGRSANPPSTFHQVPQHQPWQTLPRSPAVSYLQPQPHPYQVPPRSPDHPATGTSVWPWRPYSSRRVRRDAAWDENSQQPQPVLLKAAKEDCSFLPAGGCDNWSRDLKKMHRYYKKNVEAAVVQNTACPHDVAAMCNKIFPKNFTKEDWERGNFSVALVMQISQTFWWFGNKNRFQPFFRYNVKKTLKTDILAYDEKVILTSGWPISCVCPNKLIAGKKYLVLTHSRLSRQTLRISTNTVFLGKVKQFTKQLQCWLGSCPRSSKENRGGKYNQPQWGWQNRRRRH